MNTEMPDYIPFDPSAPAQFDEEINVDLPDPLLSQREEPAPSPDPAQKSPQPGAAEDAKNSNGCRSIDFYRQRFGESTIFLAIVPGQKRPRFKGWQNITLPESTHPKYLQELRRSSIVSEADDKRERASSSPPLLIRMRLPTWALVQTVLVSLQCAQTIP
jgi:hypothetical protein